MTDQSIVFLFNYREKLENLESKSGERICIEYNEWLKAPTIGM